MSKKKQDETPVETVETVEELPVETVEELPVEAVETAEDAVDAEELLPDGFILKRGVEILLADGLPKLRLLQDVRVEKSVAESTFAGMLSLANPAYIGMHNDTLEFNYDPNGGLVE